MKTIHPILLLAAIILPIGISCTPLSADNNTPSGTQQSRPPMTTAASSEALPTLMPPTPTKLPAFFTEEFGTDFKSDQWEVFNLGKGSTSNLVIKQEADRLLFDLGAEDVYVYYMYKPYMYSNVSLTLTSRNMGRNNNSVSLVCRMNEDASQWYEFTVTSSGLWNVLVMDKHRYTVIGRGGANFIKQGQDENEYQMVCNDDQIIVSVNGNTIDTITETTYGFKNGFVGFNISSIKDYSVLPITVAVDAFKVERP